MLLFECYVEPYHDKFCATSRDFTNVYGYGKTPEEAKESLKRVVLEVWRSYRKI